MTKLNARQRAFVDAYSAGPTLGNATQSAKRAGYNGSDATLRVTGSTLLANPNVAAELKRRAEKSERKSIMGSAERRERLSEFARGEADCEPRDSIKAIELLAKLEGEFVERRELTGKDGAPLTPTVTLTIEAARELAAKGVK